MTIPVLHSIRSIKKQYCTGEEPVLVKCSDLNEYICKYMRSSATPYKLICEVIGAILGSEWGLNIPEFAFVRIRSEHWTPFRTINLASPAFGSKFQRSVIDITSSWDGIIQISNTLKKQIMSIGLFDIWIANEDRNWNNANLMFSNKSNELMVIDHGCILNTATFDYNLSLLTENESILYSDLAREILNGISIEQSERFLYELKTDFENIRTRKNEIIAKVLKSLPEEWNINGETVRSKMNNVFDRKWMDDCWDTFIDYYKEATR